MVRPKTDKLCATGCGRFLKSTHGSFCSTCGTIYHYMMKHKKYKILPTKDLYSLIIKTSEERKKKIKENFAKCTLQTEIKLF